MAKFKILIHLFFIFAAILINNSLAAPPPDTGQNLCYDDTSEIDCNNIDSFEQDANFTINSRKYNKIDINGNIVDDSSDNWSIIYDKVTGLFWEIKTKDDSIHNMNKTYSWYNMNKDFISILNNTAFGGFSDWRIPNAKELHTIINLNNNNPSIDQNYFPNCSSAYFWSSNEKIDNMAHAWSVNFNDGNDIYDLKITKQYIRAVRGDYYFKNNNFIDNGDGTITDTETGLMWQKNGASGLSWSKALSFCNNLNLAQYDDWRLPNIDNLRTLSNFNKNNPASDNKFFPDIFSTPYWSSTSKSDQPEKAWCIHFGYGNDLYREKNREFNLRAVRAGQIQNNENLYIISPNQSDRFFIGNIMDIVWETKGIIGGVNIYISRKGGLYDTFELIEFNTPNDGYYQWTVTEPYSPNCVLKIEPIADPYKRNFQGLFSISNFYNAWIELETIGGPDKYKLLLKGRFDNSISTIKTNFTTMHEDIASIYNNTLIAKKNGWVKVSCSYLDKTYEKWIALYTSLDKEEREPDNNIYNANSISENLFYKGDFFDDQTDYYRLYLFYDSIINISYLTNSEALDTKIELFNEAGKLMASSLSFDGKPVFLYNGLKTGTYYIKLTTNGDSDPYKSYILNYMVYDKYQKVTDQSVLLNTDYHTYSGSLEETTKFIFNNTKKQAIRFNLTSNGINESYNVKILNSNYELIEEHDFYNEQITFDLILNSGLYYINIKPVMNVNVFNNFTLRLEPLNIQLEYESNDSISSANEFNYNQDSIYGPFYGRINSINDIDYFSFQQSYPGWLEIIFNSTSQNEYIISLWKDNEDQCIYKAKADKNNKEISFNIGLITGKYYIKIQSDNFDEYNYYSIKAVKSDNTLFEMEPNNTLNFANPLDDISTKKAGIFSENDVDYYSFFLASTTNTIVQFNPLTQRGDYKISLLDESQNTYAFYTTSNGLAYSLKARLFYGNYYVKVENNGDIGSNYEISVKGDSKIQSLRKVWKININSFDNTLEIGDTMHLTATTIYTDGSISIISNPVWTSLSSNIISVDSNGYIEAHNKGKTSIVAVFEGMCAKTDFFVETSLDNRKQHGNLILVASTRRDIGTDQNIESTQYLSDMIYKSFENRFFDKNDIYYINSISEHDIDGDLYDDNIVDDSTPTVLEFGNIITKWAVEQQNDGPLYIYLVGYGGLSTFEIYSNEILSGIRLNGFLDAFELLTKRPVVIIIEACKSGSFVDDLLKSDSKRVIISSADNKDSFIMLNGMISFSQFFVNGLVTGLSIYDSCLESKNILKGINGPFLYMNPQLNESKINLSKNIYLGGNFQIQDQYPEINDQSQDQSLEAFLRHEFFIQFNDDFIEWSKAVIVPPTYYPPETTSDFKVPFVSVPLISMSLSETPQKYYGSYDEFNHDGNYILSFISKKYNGLINVSKSIKISITGGNQTDTDEDGMPDSWELLYPGLNINIDDANNDLDDDGLTNIYEYNFRTNPALKDTDQDLMLDIWEINYNLDPTNPNDTLLDPDMDGVTNLQEYLDNTDPKDTYSYIKRSGNINGRVITSLPGYKTGVKNASVTLSNGIKKITQLSGDFSFTDIVYGKYLLNISSEYFQNYITEILISNENLYLGDIELNIDKTTIPCDLNQNEKMDISDIIKALQIISGM